MADTESGQEKTEPATARRREQAREQGQVPKSMEANTAVMLLAALILFYYYAPHFLESLCEIMTYYIQNAARIPVDTVSFPSLVLTVCVQLADLLWPFALTFILVALVINLLQVGLLFSGKVLIPKFNRINPKNGLKRIFSLRGVMETLKSAAKLMVIAPVMYGVVYSEIPILLSLDRMPVRDIFVELGLLTYRMVFRGIIILLILAIIDYIYQRYDNEQQLRMTKQEVKDEMKQSQGDPQIRARIRSIQRDIARRRMMGAVPEAEVVVTNPTEYAVALSYKQEKMPAPRIVAKGRGYVAQTIKQIARDHNVPIYEDRLLARTLFKLDVGSFIPPELYRAVAEVLVWVNQITGRYQDVVERHAREQERNTA
ncbi:MAG TPA: flagellar biosynthesis protein FlhB [bacterium]|nr:flagellar biosynthesis protein FlhB [bacterium]HQL61745.1 flagellar biosynthesis protein FlhB [bacterium]